METTSSTLKVEYLVIDVSWPQEVYYQRCSSNSECPCSAWSGWMCRGVSVLFFKALQKELCVHDTAMHLDCNGVYVELCVCMHAQTLQSCPTLGNLMDFSPCGSSVPGILQASVLGWVAIPSSRGSSRHRDRTHISCRSCIDRQVLYH